MKCEGGIFANTSASYHLTSRFFNIFKSRINFIKPVILTGFIFATFVVFTPPAFTATNVPNSPNSIINYTWTKNNGPYIVNGNIYYRYGSLTIEPGTVIKFASATSTLMVHADVV